MGEGLISNEDEPHLRVWAMTGARPGDNDQVIALATALGMPFEIKSLEYNRWQLLGPRLLGRSLISLTRASREQVVGEPPDLTISTGHRSVPVAQELRHRSGGRTRSIHVGFPRVSPAKFDLVIATPQYPILDHPNLLRVPYALTSAATRQSDQESRELLEALPPPRRLLIIGGPNLYWKIDEPGLLEVLRRMLAEAQTTGGSVLITTSPRTPRTLSERIKSILVASGVPSVLAAPGQAPSYASLLEAADSIRVTADSVSMVSDAIWTGDPVALIPVTPTWLGRLATAVMDRLRPDKPVYPQDLRFFWRELARIGVTERLGTPFAPSDEEMRKLLARVQPIIDSMQATSTE